jgi:hypothetical protein
MHKKWIQFFSITFFVLGLFAPNIAAATPCIYAGETPDEPLTCTEFEEAGECLEFCLQANRKLCRLDESFSSCFDFVSAQNRVNQGRVDALQREGQCLCKIGDSEDPTQPFNTIPNQLPDTCFDRNDPDYGNIYSCRWINNETDINPVDQNFKDLEPLNEQILRERTPLTEHTLSLMSLNKLRATSIQGFLGIAIRMATGILGTIALSMMVYGGFLWLTSAGNASQVEKARNVILYGALGIFVIFGSYALVNFVFEAINPIKTL